MIGKALRNQRFLSILPDCKIEIKLIFSAPTVIESSKKFISIFYSAIDLSIEKSFFIYFSGQAGMPDLQFVFNQIRRTSNRS